MYHNFFIKEIDDLVIVVFSSNIFDVSAANTFETFVNAGLFPIPKYEIIGSCINGGNQSENELIKISLDGSASISSNTTGRKYMVGTICYPKA